jgi:hypothetical protein
MYTVARFTSKSADNSVLEMLGEEVEAIRPGSFHGMRHRGDGFAIDLSSEPDWDSHRSAIEATIILLKATVARALLDGACVTIDVAVEPEDYGNAPRTFNVGSELVQLLAENRIQFALTVY